MANEEHLAQLMLGTDHWNRWRKENWIIKPDLSGINLSGWDLKGIFLSESDLRGVNFTNTNLSKSNINQAILDNAILNGANLSQTGLSGINLQSTIFGNANLKQALLSCSNLIGVDLSKVNLQRANLQGAELNHANLKGVDMSFSNLSLAKLKCTDLRNTKLCAANLYEADLREADLRGTNLDHADLRRSFLHKTQIDQTTSLAEKWLFVWKVVNQKIKINNLHGADLREVNLSGADLSQVDLSEANLIDANLSDVNFRKANLDRANLQSAKLTGAILLEASLREANLMFANLNNADLAGLDIGGTLFRVDLKGTDLFRACLFRASLWNTNLFRANLNEADLRQASLIGANLVRANISRACLELANLTQVQALETDFTESLLTGACLQDWNINNTTKLDAVVCDYFYKQLNQQERRPRNGNFAPGEFIALFQKAIETIDLIFVDGIDWKAFFQSFQDLQVQYGETNIHIQAIEKKTGDAFVIRLEVSSQIDKTAVERQAQELYETKLQLKLHQIQMQAKDKEIVLYQEQLNVQRQQNTDLIGIVKTMADKEPTNKTTIHTSNIGFVNSGSGTVSDFSQNIGQNIDEISKLIGSLREIAEKFPETQRKQAMELLEHLQEDIAKPEKQKSGRIKASIITLLTIAGVVAGATDFANNLFELSEKLGIPIDVNVPQLIQHSPVLKPNQL